MVMGLGCSSTLQHHQRENLSGVSLEGYPRIFRGQAYGHPLSHRESVRLHCYTRISCWRIGPRFCNDMGQWKPGLGHLASDWQTFADIACRLAEVRRATASLRDLFGSSSDKFAIGGLIKLQWQLIFGNKHCQARRESHALFLLFEFA